MDPKVGKPVSSAEKGSWKAFLLLAYQSLGVVYGDLSISPLFVLRSTFAGDITHSATNEEILGVLSILFWTLTLIPLLKYIFVVLRADDNGEGGTFALYSLICRHANVSLLPNRQVADEQLSTYKSGSLREKKKGTAAQIWLEKHKTLRTTLLLLVMLGTCMVIGDGVLTPAISVFSAVSGLELTVSKEHREYAVVPITCVIIVCLFILQHYGTHRVGFLFAPIILAWLLCLSALGIYNVLHWNRHVYQAISPYYIFKFFKKTGAGGWKSLGGILLCITGSEAMFADLGHFSYTAIQVTFNALVYPALILGYMGQAAYLSQNHINDPSYQIGFYDSVPEFVRWPVLILAILASIAGSQAIISATFSIINQSQSLGCFPRVKVVRTSKNIHGQVYIPEINGLLMILCIAVAIGFRDTKQMGNASGLATITVMLVTTSLTALVIILCWCKPLFLALAFVLIFGSVEALFFSASLVKFFEGAWLPILLALFLMSVMFVWHYATIKKYEFDLNNKVTLDWLLALGDNLGIARVSGIGLVYTDLISGVPANFSHFVTNLPAFHRILVFVCIKYVPVPFVPPAERYLVGRVGPSYHRSYRCIVRYGYRDVHQYYESFESDLVSSLADFIKLEASQGGNQHNEETDGNDDKLIVVSSPMLTSLSSNGVEDGIQLENLAVESPPEGNVKEQRRLKKVRFLIENGSNPGMDRRVSEELHELWEAQEAGTVFILGRSHVRASNNSHFMKKLAIDYGYNFLRRNSRGPDVVLRVPPASLLEVGMVYIL